MTTEYRKRVETCAEFKNAIEAGEVLGLEPMHFHFSGGWETRENNAPIFLSGPTPVEDVGYKYFTIVADGAKFEVSPIETTTKERGYIEIEFRG